MSQSNTTRPRAAANRGARWLEAWIAILSVIAPGVVMADTITVGGSGASVPTISVGVSTAANGDTLLIHPATYYEVLNTSKPLTLIADGSPGSVVIDGTSFTRVLSFSNVDGDVVLDGITVRNGQVAGPGGGILLNGISGNCEIRNCTFTGNIASTEGGAIRVDGADLVLDGCVFENNTVNGVSTLRGGAVSVASGAGCSITGCDFTSNDADYGGAVYSAGQLSISGCTFLNNVAALRGGAIYGANLASTALDSNYYEGNGAGDFGGAVFLSGTGGLVQGDTFKANSCAGGMGGAIYLQSGSGFTITRCIFNQNSAEDGGSVAGASMMAVVSYCTFYGSAATNHGAALYCNQSSPNVYRNIFCGSSGAEAAWCEAPSSPSFACNDWHTNGAGDVGGADDPLGSNGNFNDDPLFCDAPGDDFTVDAGSSCATGNAPDGCETAQIGAGGVGCGASRTESTSWGALKARYR